MIRAALAFLFIATAAIVAHADERVTMQIDQAVPLELGWSAVRGVCDDPAVVRVEDNDGHLRLHGLSAGHTHCGFWPSAKSAPRIVDIQVVARQ